jgi:hypothetical protein
MNAGQDERQHGEYLLVVALGQGKILHDGCLKSLKRKGLDASSNPAGPVGRS